LAKYQLIVQLLAHFLRSNVQFLTLPRLTFQIILHFPGQSDSLTCKNLYCATKILVTGTILVFVIVFTARRHYASAVYAMTQCLTVRVCLSQVGVAKNGSFSIYFIFFATSSDALK